MTVVPLISVLFLILTFERYFLYRSKNPLLNFQTDSHSTGLHDQTTEYCVNDMMKNIVVFFMMIEF